MQCVHKRQQLTLFKLSLKKTLKKCKKAKEFDPYLWERPPVQEVATLPCGIDGLAVYIITNVPLETTNRLPFCPMGGNGKKAT